jgi:HSP20 family molecular chaperone IbpA
MSPALYPSPHDGQRPAATATMPSLRAVQLELLQDRLSNLAGQLALVRWGARPEGRVWAPRLNAYRERDRLVLCVELAGVGQADIELLVEPRRVWLSGERRTPWPAGGVAELRQVLALEIDDGRWERELALPDPVVPEATRAEQRNGLLWIELPLERRP